MRLLQPDSRSLPGAGPIRARGDGAQPLPRLLLVGDRAGLPLPRAGSALRGGGPGPPPMEIVVRRDLDGAERELAGAEVDVAVVDLSRDGTRRLAAVARWRLCHPHTAWVALTGAGPQPSEEAVLRAGIHERVSCAALRGPELERAIRCARARRDALPPAQPPPWDGVPVQSSRLASLGALAAGVAHEINNPMAYVRSNLDFVAEEFAELEQRLRRMVRRFPNVAGGVGGLPDLQQRVDELHQALAEAREGVTHVSDVVGGLKQFSSRPHAEVREVDLRRVAESALRIATVAVGQRAQLKRRLGPVPLVRASEAYLGQVVLNLLVNAAQAIPEGTPADHHIRVATRADGAGRAVLEVADTGHGMPPEVVSRIFEPFFTTKPPDEGTGLGLAVARRVVESFGGTLTCKSREGHGSTFRIRLPPA